MRYRARIVLLVLKFTSNNLVILNNHVTYRSDIDGAWLTSASDIGEAGETGEPGEVGVTGAGLAGLAGEAGAGGDGVDGGDAAGGDDGLGVSGGGRSHWVRRSAWFT